MPDVTLYIVLLVICLAFSAFFSGAETAFISVQHFRLEHLVSTGAKGAKGVHGLIARPERFLSVVLLGNTLVNSAATALATSMAVYWWGEEGIIIAPVARTAVLLVFCDASPKTIAAGHAEGLSLLLYRPLKLIS